MLCDNSPSANIYLAPGLFDTRAGQIVLWVTHAYAIEQMIYRGQL